jgi:hypothetical protein
MQTKQSTKDALRIMDRIGTLSGARIATYGATKGGRLFGCDVRDFIIVGIDSTTIAAALTRKTQVSDYL